VKLPNVDRYLARRPENNRGIWRLVGAVLSSRFFMLALLVHLLLFLLWGGSVIMTYLPRAEIFEPNQALLVLPPPTPPPPPTKQVEAETKEVRVTVEPKTQVRRLTVDRPSDFVKTPSPRITQQPRIKDFKVKTDLSRQIADAKRARYTAVKNFQAGWGVKGRGRNTKASFTIFKAKYQDGDWNCNPNDVPNLLFQIRKWSKDRLQANEHTEILDVGTEQLFEIKPPFVYLTGHKDFTLTETEVNNLREYLMLGGCVWADSALAGRRSRFDVAFRREMKRVLPDRDFEEIPDGHEMFDTFFPQIGLPSGMNFYQEPAEMINIGDELAVLYTLNGYGHFWEAKLDDHNDVDTRLVNLGGTHWGHTYGPHWAGQYSGVVFRNYDNEHVKDSYRFGVNVVVHLLVRYQDKFIMAK